MGMAASATKLFELNLNAIELVWLEALEFDELEETIDEDREEDDSLLDEDCWLLTELDIELELRALIGPGSVVCFLLPPPPQPWSIITANMNGTKTFFIA